MSQPLKPTTTLKPCLNETLNSKPKKKKKKKNWLPFLFLCPQKSTRAHIASLECAIRKGRPSPWTSTILNMYTENTNVDLSTGSPNSSDKTSKFKNPKIKNKIK